MIVHILGCGPSGADYKATGERCIGVNDAAKWGEKFSDLLLVNSPVQFELARQEVIRNTSASNFVILHSIVSAWEAFGIQATHEFKAELFPGNHNIKREGIYYTNNSPFVAMTFAVTQGATKVILHGVDFDGHKYLRFEDCVQDFYRYSQWCNKQGIKIYKGSNKSRLVLEVYKP